MAMNLTRSIIVRYFCGEDRTRSSFEDTADDVNDFVVPGVRCMIIDIELTSTRLSNGNHVIRFSPRYARATLADIVFFTGRRVTAILSGPEKEIWFDLPRVRDYGETASVFPVFLPLQVLSESKASLFLRSLSFVVHYSEDLPGSDTRVSPNVQGTLLFCDEDSGDSGKRRRIEDDPFSIRAMERDRAVICDTAALNGHVITTMVSGVSDTVSLNFVSI